MIEVSFKLKEPIYCRKCGIKTKTDFNQETYIVKCSKCKNDVYNLYWYCLSLSDLTLKLEADIEYQANKGV
jgi:hypothetical protein